MACYHPLKGFPIGKNPSGKTDYKVVSYLTDHVELLKTGTWNAVPYPDVGANAIRVVREFVEIPCGQCLGCRLAYSRQWADRCMLELQYHKSSYFVTLTYRDEDVPRSWYSIEETGEAFQALTLCKRDVQLFMKRLRKRFEGQTIRFFLAGEYGGQTYRPHYHAIIFGLSLDDLEVYRRSNGYTLYTSKTMTDLWGKGHVVVGEVTWETCAYTARYITKKLKGDAAYWYEYHNILPEFTLMSRRPGIARQYYDDHPDLYEHESIHISGEKGGRTIRPPRYYDNLFDADAPERMAEIKEIRKRTAEEAKKLKLERSSLSYLDLLAVEEESLKRRTRSLQRKLENEM